MHWKISKLSRVDLDAVDNIMKRYSRTLGFLPKEALLSYLNKGSVLGIKTNDGQLVAYLLYANNPKYFRITHLCILEEYRGQGMARSLVNKLKESATTQKVITLHCRHDFSVNQMWPKLGFVALGEKLGRSKDRHPLTFWCLTLAPDEQLDIFQVRTSDDRLDVIIDAQVFFHFDGPDTNNSKPSKALLSDFLIDSLKLWITDELFNEINRKADRDLRTKSRNRAHTFPQVVYDSQSAEHFERQLKQILPDNSRSQISDIRHLARTAASDIDFFVTQDRNLLREANEIEKLTRIKIISPSELIIRLHQLSESQSYMPDRISGLNLEWRRMTSSDITSFPFNFFLNEGERKGRFREILHSFLATPGQYRCEILWVDEEMRAIRILETIEDKIFILHMGRVASFDDQWLFEKFLIADTIYKAVNHNMEMIQIKNTAVAPILIKYLSTMGFVKCNEDFVKFCFSLCLERNDVLHYIQQLSPQSFDLYNNMSNIEFERYCSPLALDLNHNDPIQNCFLIPIRPGYAISLFDRNLSSNDLFGGERSVLLRWDNVYYRANTRYRMLRTPARILWYVSDPQKAIVGTSHLDAVEVDTARALFRKFKRFGILEWRDIYRLCHGDPSREIMALQFSHTFLFHNYITLDILRTIFAEDRVGLALQSPSRVPIKTFQKLFQLGYTNRS